MTRQEREADDEWLRLPGLFYDSELGPAPDSTEFRCELVGHNSIGLALFAVYHRLPPRHQEGEQ